MRKNRIKLVFSLLLAFLLSSFSGFAQSPGTVSDPLVTKSYIDHFFKFRSVVFPNNTKVKPNAGALIIVRSGVLKLTCPNGKGIVDLTAGKEINTGQVLPLNHLLIIPDSAEYMLEAQKLSLVLAACLQESIAK